MLVLTTPTGRIGSQVLERLLATQEEIRVIVRDPSRLDPRTTGRVEVVRGTHDDPAVVTAAFDGADGVLWIVPPDSRVDDVVEHYTSFTRAACRGIETHGVARVVAVSSMGREAGEVARRAGHLTAAFVMEELLEDTGASLRALRLPFFRENLLDQVQGIRERGVFALANTGHRPLATVATADVAAAATALLLDRTWTGRAGVPVAGPDDLTPQEMARVMSTSLQREVGFEQLDVGELGSALVRYGMAQGAARGVAEMVAAQNDGIYDDEPRSTPSLAPTTSFARWCDDVLAPAVSAPTP